MAFKTIQVNEQLQEKLLAIGKLMSPHTDLKMPQILENLIARYEGKDV